MQHSRSFEAHERGKVGCLCYPFVELVTKGLLRDTSQHGIFALRLGPTTHNVISNPALVKNVMQQKESAVEFQPIAWAVVRNFFGIPSRLKSKYFAIWEELSAPVTNGLMSDPGLSTFLESTMRSLQSNIPSMITFVESPIDQHPWEKVGRAVVTSESPGEVEVDLMGVTRHLLGHASVPSIFGSAFLEKYPHTLEDIFILDKGFNFLVAGVPAWLPISSTATRAHIARYILTESLQEFAKALDAVEEGKYPGEGWGDMEDVSELIKKRHEVWRKAGMPAKERYDISVSSVNWTPLNIG